MIDINQYSYVKSVAKHNDYNQIIKQTAVTCGLIAPEQQVEPTIANAIINGLAEVLNTYPILVPATTLFIENAQNKTWNSRDNEFLIRFGKKKAILQEQEYRTKITGDKYNSSDYYNFDFNILSIDEIYSHSSYFSKSYVKLFEETSGAFSSIKALPSYFFDKRNDYQELHLRIPYLFGTTFNIFPLEIKGRFDFWEGREITDNCGNSKKILSNNPIVDFVINFLGSAEQGVLQNVINIAKAQILTSLGISEQITQSDWLALENAKNKLKTIKNKGYKVTIG